ncbi:unnamed protein product, partial [Gongylonema pulchrum]|uniref:EF-hand domain-containing protein n=1 Tax=Gongylonema pulchrum TaxID=637853 RepID=A0A183EVR1_9BILA
MLSLNLEESNERFQEIDENRDNYATWDEYVNEAFGGIDPEDESLDVEDKRLLEEDRMYFN